MCPVSVRIQGHGRCQTLRLGWNKKLGCGPFSQDPRGLIGTSVGEEFGSSLSDLNIASFFSLPVTGFFCFFTYNTETMATQHLPTTQESDTAPLSQSQF